MLKFNQHLFFDGAVEIDWIASNPGKAELAANNYVFFSDQFSRQGLSSHGAVNEVVDFIDSKDRSFAFIKAPYGTGKSHFILTLCALFLNNEDLIPIGHLKNNFEDICGEQCPNVQGQNIVVPINGSRDFDLKSLIPTIIETLNKFGLKRHDLDFLFEINGSFLQMADFVEKYWASLPESPDFTGKSDLLKRDKNYLVAELENLSQSVFGYCNRWRESLNLAELILPDFDIVKLLQEVDRKLLGSTGKYTKLILVFDEFGLYVKSAARNHKTVNLKEFQRLYEAVKACENVKFLGTVHHDLSHYYDLADDVKEECEKYLGRYQSTESYTLNFFLEAVMVNLIEFEGQKCEIRLQRFAKLYELLNHGNHSVVDVVSFRDPHTYERYYLNELYPCNPIAIALLVKSAKYLQGRSPIRILRDAVQRFGLDEQSNHITPFDLLESGLLEELNQLEQEGKIQHERAVSLTYKYNSALNESFVSSSNNPQLVKEVFAAIFTQLILKIRFLNDDKLHDFLYLITNGSREEVVEVLHFLSHEVHAIEKTDEGFYEFRKSSINPSEFLEHLDRQKRTIERDNISIFSKSICEALLLNDRMNSGFDLLSGIKTKEWTYKVLFCDLDSFKNQISSRTFKMTADRFKSVPKQKDQAFEARGILNFFVYRDEAQLNEIHSAVKEAAQNYPQVTSLVVLINDTTSNFLEESRELAALKRFSDEKILSYASLYYKRLTKSLKSLRNLFHKKLADAVYISNGDLIKSTSFNLSEALLEAYKQKYSQVPSLYFDELDSKQLKGCKQIVEICKSLLKAKSFDYLEKGSNSPQRINTCLTGFGGWDILDAQNKLKEPGNKKLLAVFQLFEEELLGEDKLTLLEICQRLIAPPFGMNEYSVFLAFSLWYALDKSLKLTYNDKPIDNLYIDQASAQLFDSKSDSFTRKAFQLIGVNQVDQSDQDLFDEAEAIMKSSIAVDDKFLSLKELSSGCTTTQTKTAIDKFIHDLTIEADYLTKLKRLSKSIKSLDNEIDLSMDTDSFNFDLTNLRRVLDKASGLIDHKAKVESVVEFADKYGEINYKVSWKNLIRNIDFLLKQSSKIKITKGQTLYEAENQLTSIQELSNLIHRLQLQDSDFCVDLDNSISKLREDISSYSKLEQQVSTIRITELCSVEHLKEKEYEIDQFISQLEDLSIDSSHIRQSISNLTQRIESIRSQSEMAINDMLQSMQDLCSTYDINLKDVESQFTNLMKRSDDKDKIDQIRLYLNDIVRVTGALQSLTLESFQSLNTTDTEEACRLLSQKITFDSDYQSRLFRVDLRRRVQIYVEQQKNKLETWFSDEVSNIDPSVLSIPQLVSQIEKWQKAPLGLSESQTYVIKNKIERAKSLIDKNAVTKALGEYHKLSEEQKKLFRSQIEDNYEISDFLS